MTIAFPAFLISYGLADDIIKLLFGEEYIDAAPLIKILSFGYVIFIAIGPMGALFNILGKNWLRMWIMLFCAIFNVSLNIYLIKKIGLSGAALSTSIGFFLLNFIFLLCLRLQVKDYHSSRINTLYTASTLFVLFILGWYIPLFNSFQEKAIISIFMSLFTFTIGATLLVKKSQNHINRTTK